MRIFEHNFVADKAKIRRRAVARQEFLTQSAAKFAEKTCAYACEDRFLYGNNGSEKSSIARADGQKRSDHAVMVFDREFIKNSFENYSNLNKMRS